MSSLHYIKHANGTRDVYVDGRHVGPVAAFFIVAMLRASFLVIYPIARLHKARHGQWPSWFEDVDERR